MRAVIRAVLVVVLASWAVLHAYTPAATKWPAGSVVPYYVNATNPLMTDSQVLDAIQLAAQAWNINADVTLTFAGRTETVAPVRNGLNEVMFIDDVTIQHAGQVKRWWSGGMTTEVDVVLRYNVLPLYAEDEHCVGTALYLRDLMTHEFGHVLGLSHSAVKKATMYPTTSKCLENWRTLHQDDVDGLLSLYPVSGWVAPLATLDVTLFELGARLTWAWLSGSRVDVWQGGMMVLGDTKNDGVHHVASGAAGFQVCDGSTCTPSVMVR